jgi:hypothetical protein
MREKSRTHAKSLTNPGAFTSPFISEESYIAVSFGRFSDGQVFGPQQIIDMLIQIRVEGHRHHQPSRKQ